ncbi:mate-domain-containing protein [Coemansia spiralis]|nr:mate-domain-containing protein [Coemansia spiralis]
MEANLEIIKHDSTEPYFHIAKEELKWMATSSSLTIVTLILQYSFYFVNVVSVSHLGANKLAAMSLSITSQGIFVVAPTLGLLSAMETFCSTAYTASSNKTLVGFHLQRGIIAVCFHFILVLPILWNLEKLLLLIGQDPEISHLSGLFMRINILLFLPYGLFEAIKRFLLAQGIMRVSTIVVIIVAPMNWLINFTLVRSSTYGLGFIGAPIAGVITYILVLIVAFIYMYNSRAMEAWGGWKVSAFHNMSAFYRLAIPAVITVCAEWVCFEMLTIGASYFGANQMAGQVVLLSTVGLMVQFSNGLGFGTSPRIGNLIGAAKPRQARIAADMAVLASLFLGAMGSLFLAMFGKWWISIYTDDPAVAYESVRLIPAACAFIVGNGLNAMFSAILRGLGRQRASANSFMFGFYVFAVPLGIYFAYARHLETLGLWLGVSIGILVSSIFQLLYIYLWLDWKNEVRLCLLRLKINAQSG